MLHLWNLFRCQNYASDDIAILNCISTAEQIVSRTIEPLTCVAVYQPCVLLTVAILFSQLICHRCTGDLALVDMLVNNLLGWLIDTSSIVRRLCIRGLGNISCLGPQLVRRFPPPPTAGSSMYDHGFMRVKSEFLDMFYV